MKRLFFLLIACLPLLAAAQLVLPVVRKGQWLLADTTGRVLITTPYQYIHTFDAKGFAYYAHHSSYGIIDRTGKAVTPPMYSDIFPYGEGLFATRDSAGWNLLQCSDSVHLLAIEQEEAAHLLGKSWLSFTENDRQQLLHLPSGKRVLLSDTMRLVTVVNDYLVLQLDDSTQIVRDPGNRSVLTGRFYSFQQQGMTVFRGERRLLLSDEKGPWQLPETVLEFSITATTVFIRSERSGTLYDRRTRQALLTGNYTFISVYDDTHFSVAQNGFQNLLHRTTHQLLFPQAYIRFMRVGNYFEVWNKESRAGLCDTNGRLVIPCRFDRLDVEKEWATTYLLQFKGLFSLKSKREVLPPTFGRIERSEQRVKAYYRNYFVALLLDDRHAVVKRIAGENALRIETTTPKYTRPDFHYDPRLLPLGWFVDSTEITTPAGDKRMRYAWGLKNDRDSILSKSRFSNLHYAEGPFSLNIGSVQEHELISGQRVKARFIQPVAHQTGKQSKLTALVYYDSLDFRKRAFTRFSTLTDFGILRADGNFFMARYIQQDDEPILRYCTGESTEVSTATEETTPVTDLYFRKDAVLNPFVAPTMCGNFRTLHYPGAKWNFLLPDGRNLSPEPFDFAEAFLGSGAIVKRDGKWGVLGRDSLLIPVEYAHIERKITGLDTFYIARTIPKGLRFLDSSLAIVPGIQSVVSTKGSLTVVQASGSQRVIDGDYREVGTDAQSFKLHEFGYFSMKNGKETQLYDSTGALLATLTHKIKTFISPAYFTSEKNGKTGLFDLHDTEIVPVEANAVSMEGPYLHTVVNGTHRLLTTSRQQLFSWSEGKVLVDPVTGEFAHVTNGKTLLYASTGKRVARLKAFQPDALFNGRFILQKAGAGIYDRTGKCLLSLERILDTRIYGTEYYAVKADKIGWLLFDHSWKQQQPTETPVRKLNHHGGSLFSSWDASGLYTLRNAATGQSLEGLTRVEGTVNNGCLLVEKQQQCYFVAENLAPVNRFRYLDATPFTHGFAAVKDQRGWTLINAQNLPVSYPNFPQIRSVGAKLFAASKQPVYTVFNSKGNIIVPPGAERVIFISDRIIQVITLGEIGYFTTDGRKLF